MGKRKIFYEVDPKKIVFVTDSATTDPPGKKKIQSVFRIGIQYNFDGKHVPLILAPKGCKFHSFGIQKNRINGIDTGTYGMCLCINYNTKSENSSERDFCAYVHAIYDECRKYLVENKDELGIKYKDDNNFKHLFKSPLKEDIDNNNKNPEYHHFKIYPKMIMNKTNVNNYSKMTTDITEKDYIKIWTEFYDINNDEKLDPWDFENVQSRVFPAILFDSIFVSSTGPSLQCKLSEAIIEKVQSPNVYSGPSLDKSFLNIKIQ